MSSPNVVTVQIRFRIWLFLTYSCGKQPRAYYLSAVPQVYISVKQYELLISESVCCREVILLNKQLPSNGCCIITCPSNRSECYKIRSKNDRNKWTCDVETRLKEQNISNIRKYYGGINIQNKKMKLS